MFHVLTQVGEWGERSDTVLESRVYLGGDRWPESNHLLSRGELNIEEIRKYPALLVSEPDSRNPQPARLVYIDRLVPDGRHVRITYHPDPDASPIAPDHIVEVLSEAGMNRMSLNHSAWRFVDDDLFKLLFRHAHSMRMTPSVFSFDAYHHPDPNLVSVMMPFDAAFTPIYGAIAAAVQEAGYNCARADDIWNNEHIIQDVVDLIASARVVICDLSGKNSNVFYEAGIAHSLGKHVILITQSMADVPFDLRAIRCLTYLKNDQGLEKLKNDLMKKLVSL